MSLLAQPVSPAPGVLPTDALDEGNLFLELQVPSWPAPVTQTLLRNRDSRHELIVRAKPSGRLRVELRRPGYPPLVVRTVHLRLRAPGLLRLNVVWRGEEAAVAAGGQIIGTSSQFSPEGMVTPEMVEETEAPLDHIGNERAQETRRKKAEALLQQMGGDTAQVRAWFGALAATAQATTDLVELVRQGRSHHLPGLIDHVVHMMAGEAPLLQFCAGLVDAPLLVHAPHSSPREASGAVLMASAFDVAAARGQDHELAVDLDVWLHHEHPWIGGRMVPVEALLLAADSALSPPSANHVDAQDDRLIRTSFAQPQTVQALCTFATTACSLAASVIQQADESSAGQ